MIERMGAHRASHTVPRCARVGDVAAICHVRPAAALVGMKEISAEDLAVLFRDEDFVARRMLVGERVLPRHLARQGVGLARADHRLQDPPDGRSVTRLSRPNQHPQP